MLLSKVTECDYNNSGQYFRNRREYIEMLDKYLQEYIVQQYANEHKQKIPEQLYPASQGRSGKNNKTVEKKSSRKTDRKCYQEGSNMRTDCTNRCIKNLLIQDEIIADEIDKNIQHSIACSASRIPESLHRHELLKRRIN